MSPYAALLSVRQIEEQQAEAMLGEAMREVDAAGKLLAQVRSTRAAWLAEHLDTALTEILTGLERAEREADERLADVERQAAAARQVLLERQRRRKVVETLHTEALAAAAREEARRIQLELDDLGSRAVGAFTEPRR